ncbi:rRNA-processing protein UTP23-like [Tropilaelaps mercedesae]|uniref:rRNA-processing protein UTP23-like n=1 Tax=Tropilaelaps mercedesae TaxID=418985 RepID=A0A1V9XBH9_9ACAR|nr:rRNA-processing protein UTP23-like [Tropilaelaps mercedesae]
MKINRYKRAQKNLAFYLRHFQLGEKSRYFVLTDGTFCQAALRHRVNIKDQIDKYFRAEVTLCTTQCAVVETQKLSILHGALQIIKHYRIEKCPHSKPVPASNCFLEMNCVRLCCFHDRCPWREVREGNPKKYFVATQDPELAEEIYKLIGVPRLKLRNAITLEDPAAATVDHVNKLTRATTHVTEQQLKTIKQLKEKMNIEDPSKKVKRLRKKPKGPNPLSCLPKKRKKVIRPADSDHDSDARKDSNPPSKTARRKMRLKKMKAIRSAIENDQVRRSLLDARPALETNRAK